MAKARFLVCGPTPDGTYSVLVEGSPVFRDMKPAEIVKFLQAAMIRHELDVSYSRTDGTPHDGIPAALAEANRDAGAA